MAHRTRYKTSKQLNSVRARSVGVWIRPQIWTFTVVTTLLLGCGSDASLEWESHSRTAMSNRLSRTIRGSDVSVRYNALTATLAEDERGMVNILLDRILSKHPQTVDIEATVESALSSVEHLKQLSELRARLKEVLQLKIQIAENADKSLGYSLIATKSAKVEQMMEYLQASLKLNSFASKNSGFKEILDDCLPRITAHNRIEVAFIWTALKAEDHVKSQQMDTILNIAKFATEGNFIDISAKLKIQDNQEPLISLLAKLKSEDRKSQDFLTAAGSVEKETYGGLTSAIELYSTTDATQELKTAIGSLISKTSAIEKSLRGDFVSLLVSTLEKSDAVVRLNRINASTDLMQGEGFFDDLHYTNTYISNNEAPSCALRGTGLSHFKYSFKWTNGDAVTYFDWTQPSTAKSHSSKVFNVNETVQCFARILFDNNVVAELRADKVTINPAP